MINKIKPIVEAQIDQLRSMGVDEHEIGRRMKAVGIPSDKRGELGLPVPAKPHKRETELEPEIDFLKDVSSYLEYAHRELVPVKSKYPDAVSNLMAWHRKINRRIDQLRAEA